MRDDESDARNLESEDDLTIDLDALRRNQLREPDGVNNERGRRADREKPEENSQKFRHLVPLSMICKAVNSPAPHAADCSSE
jgi:hypothetical protein